MGTEVGSKEGVCPWKHDYVKDKQQDRYEQTTVICVCFVFLKPVSLGWAELLYYLITDIKEKDKDNWVQLLKLHPTSHWCNGEARRDRFDITEYKNPPLSSNTEIYCLLTELQ